MQDPRTIGATVKAVDGVVVIDGLGCMAVTMSPEVAAKVSNQLLYAAAEATGQFLLKRDTEQWERSRVGWWPLSTAPPSRKFGSD